MTAALATMMRQSFNNKAEIVSLEAEIEHVESYLMIQKLRYMDKLNFSVSLEEGIRECPIVKLVLQPLVENAIYHGIRYKNGSGTVRVIAKREGEEIHITVEDDGVGMSEQALQHIFDEHKVNYNSNGVGVYNVERRLKLYYGNAYGLFYESERNRGTRVLMKIPGGMES